MAICVALGTRVVFDSNVVTDIQIPTIEPAPEYDGVCEGFYLLTKAEVSALQASPLLISVEDGLLLSGSILTLWAIAWAIRATRKALD